MYREVSIEALIDFVPSQRWWWWSSRFYWI